MRSSEPSQPAPSPRTRRRWFQYSLRTLLIVMTAAAVLFALTSWLGSSGVALVGVVAGAIAFVGGLMRGTGSLLITGLVVGGLSLLIPAFEVPVWCGSRTQPVVVDVQDAASGQPLSGASVCVQPTRWTSSRVPVRSTQGRAQPTTTFFTCGSDQVFDRSYAVMYLWDQECKVQATGYEDFHATLDELIGKRNWPLDGPPLPTIIVKLKRR